MKVNIYYGGRGVLDDPTIYVLNKMEEVLAELRVSVTRYNIYEHKSSIKENLRQMREEKRQREKDSSGYKRQKLLKKQ